MGALSSRGGKEAANLSNSFLNLLDAGGVFSELRLRFFFLAVLLTMLFTP